METIQESARKTVSGLKETLVADTVDFIVNASLQILSLTRRDDDDMNVTNKIARSRMTRFNTLMQRLVTSFVQDDEQAFRVHQKLLVSALEKTDEALAVSFRKLMQTWKSERAADSVGALIDPQASATEDLKSLCVTTTAKSSGLDSTKSSEGSEMTALTAEQLLGSQKIHKLSGLAKTLTNTLSKTISSSARPPTNTFSEQQSPELPDASVAQQQQQQLQQPCESNAFGVETRDGVLVGHPPPYPPGLLDWESPEDNEEFEELVSNRRARMRTQASMKKGDRKASNGEDNNVTSLTRHNSDSDDGWVCL